MELVPGSSKFSLYPMTSWTCGTRKSKLVFPRLLAYPNFRVHHFDQQVHCPLEGLPQYRTASKFTRNRYKSRPSWIEPLARRGVGTAPGTNKLESAINARFLRVLPMRFHRPQRAPFGPCESRT